MHPPMQALWIDISKHTVMKSQKNATSVIMTHSGEKQNKCNHCEYATSRVSSLRRHLKSHSGEKPNKCILCDYTSIKAGNLRKHWKTHSGEKSNKWNQCAYAFFQAGHLREHLTMHSGEKLHRCIREALKKKYGIIWEFFPTWGGVFPIPKTFVILP